MVTLEYERASYRFWLLSNGCLDRVNATLDTAIKGVGRRKVPWKPKGKEREGMRDLPLMLAKANASVTRRFMAYLAEAFQVTLSPLRLAPDFLIDTLETYVGSLHTYFHDVSSTNNINASTLLKDTIGTLKLTVSVSEPDIAQNLRTIDIDVPANTLHQLLKSTTINNDGDSSSTFPAPADQSFLTSLQTHIHARTGLILPLANSTQDPLPQSPLRLTRISCSAFALSAEGRLKLSSKAWEALDAPEIRRFGMQNPAANRSAYNRDDANHAMNDEEDYNDNDDDEDDNASEEQDASSATGASPSRRRTTKASGSKKSNAEKDASGNMVRKQNTYLLESLVRECMHKS